MTPLRAKLREQGYLDKPGRPDVVYYPTDLATMWMPYTEASASAPWTSSSGNRTLRLTPRVLTTAGGSDELVPLPYGAGARLAAIALTTAVRALPPGSTEVRLGTGVNAVLRRLGRTTSGGRDSGAQTLRIQLRRLLLALSAVTEHDDGTAIRTVLTPAVDVLTSKIRLSPTFVDQVRQHSLPLDARVIRALGKNSLAIDLYAYFTYRTHRATRKLEVPYDWLEYQAGGRRYANPAAFRLKVRKLLPQLRSIIPGFGYSANPGDDRITVWRDLPVSASAPPSPPPTEGPPPPRVVLDLVPPAETTSAYLPRYAATNFPPYRSAEPETCWTSRTNDHSLRLYPEAAVAPHGAQARQALIALTTAIRKAPPGTTRVEIRAQDLDKATRDQVYYWLRCPASIESFVNPRDGTTLVTPALRIHEGPTTTIVDLNPAWLDHLDSLVELDPALLRALQRDALATDLYAYLLNSLDEEEAGTVALPLEHLHQQTGGTWEADELRRKVLSSLQRLERLIPNLHHHYLESVATFEVVFRTPRIAPRAAQTSHAYVT